MIQCKICNDVLKGKNKAKDHHERFHEPPHYNTDGTIQINAIHRITLILKGTRTWDEMVNEEHKQSRKFKRVDYSALRSIEQLRKFEEENNIEFNYHEKDEISITRLDESKHD